MVQIKLRGRTRRLSDLSMDVCFPQVLFVSRTCFTTHDWEDIKV